MSYKSENMELFKSKNKLTLKIDNLNADENNESDNLKVEKIKNFNHAHVIKQKEQKIKDFYAELKR
jgi:hypothetical protein